MPRSPSSTSLPAPAPKAPAAAAAAPTALPALPHRGEPPAQSPPPAGLSDGRAQPAVSHTGLQLPPCSPQGASQEGVAQIYLISRNLVLGLANGKMMMMMLLLLKPFHASKFFFIVCLSSLYSLFSPFSPPFCFLFSSSSSSSQGLLCSCWGVGHGGEGGGMPGVFQSGIISRSCGMGERWPRHHQGRWKELEMGQGNLVLLEPAATRTLPTKQLHVLTILRPHPPMACAAEGFCLLTFPLQALLWSDVHMLNTCFWLRSLLSLL